MKRTLILFCCLAIIQCRTVAQTAIVFETLPIAGGTSVILPTYDNLFKLLNGTGKNIATSMAQSHYKEDPENPGTFNIPRIKITKDAKEVYMYYSTTEDYIKYFEALEEDIKKRFPDVKHETAEHSTEGYGFTVKGSGKGHYYYITIIKDRTFGSSVTLHDGH